ncbi:hypothetical protein SRABI06_04234 [Pseudomonas brassicacearum]|nr:hypothetical protein SRABI06_04234 [Pseudomonas brassicacearum]
MLLTYKQRRFSEMKSAVFFGFLGAFLVYIRFCGNGYWRFRSYSGSLLKSPEAGPVKSKQNAFAPPLGASLRLGMPSLRHCSVGPPRRAIHGPARLPRHPCRGAHCAMPAFGQRGLTGLSDQDQDQDQDPKQSKSGIWGMSGIHVAESPLSRAGSLPHWIFGRHNIRVLPEFLCGSELARDEASKPQLPCV